MSESNTQVSATQQSEEDKSWLSELDQVDKLIEEDDMKNRKYRKSLLFLLPFQRLLPLGHHQVFQEHPQDREEVLADLQEGHFEKPLRCGNRPGPIFTTFYIGGSLEILGINPIAVY
jgi:hypothetical protein